jgi:hypothetical protein
MRPLTKSEIASLLSKKGILKNEVKNFLENINLDIFEDEIDARRELDRLAELYSWEGPTVYAIASAITLAFKDV